MSQSDPIGTPINPAPPATAPAAMGYAAPGPAYAGPAPTADDAQVAMLAHILDFTVLGPLIIYLVKKDSSPFVADQTREALNFSLLYFIAAVALNILIVIVMMVSHVLGMLASLLPLALLATVLILGIMAGMEAKKGVAYRYPFNVRLIK